MRRGDMRSIGQLVRQAGLVLAIAAIASAALLAQAGKTTTVLIVRHAEKAAEPADDPPLTAAGDARARELWVAIKDAGVTAVITTQLLRTRATAQPTVDATHAPA